MHGSTGFWRKAGIKLVYCLGWSVIPLGAVALEKPLTSGTELASATVPAAPTNLRLIIASYTQVGLEWDDNSGNETDFQVEVRTWDGTFRSAGLALAPTGLTEGLEPNTLYIFRVRARNAVGASPYSNELAVSTQDLPSTCITDTEILCLQNNRFKVRAYWETEDGRRGTGKAVKLTSESGYFWFFDQNNVEMLVKVLNGCVPNNRYWVFTAGLTDQRVFWTVTDTLNGDVKTYQNPLKVQFSPQFDVNVGFCP